MLEKSLHAEQLEVIKRKPIETPVVAITGGKGGVGKSTIAVNIAEALVESGCKVSLVDADVDAPDDHILLNIPLANPLKVATTVPVINNQKCTNCRKCVDVCRRHALFQPEDSSPILVGECNGCEACILVCPSEAIEIGKRTVGKTYKIEMNNFLLFSGELVPGAIESSFVVNELKQRVFHESKNTEIIIIDTSPGVHCNVINALKGSNEAFAVTEPTRLGVHGLNLILRLLQILHITANIILNRSDLPGDREQTESISKTYGTHIAAELPMDDLLVKSYIEGVPMVRRYPEAESSRRMRKLAVAIAAKYVR